MINNQSRMEKCPHFNSCSCPKCPLDELIDLRVSYPEEQKCKAKKSIRILLGKDMKYKGLTKREYSGIMNSHSDLKAHLTRFELPRTSKLKVLCILSK